MFLRKYEDLLISGTKTENALSSAIKIKENVREPKGFLEVGLSKLFLNSNVFTE